MLHNNTIILSSGRSFYAYKQCLGLEPEARVLREGWDGEATLGDDDNADFSPDERREIAEMMIDRWKRWGGIT